MKNKMTLRHKVKSLILDWDYYTETPDITVDLILEVVEKAIMERKPKDRITITEPFGLPYNYGYNKALQEFESVIKEILTK